MRTRAEEPQQLPAQQLAAAAAMSTGASNQALAQAAAGQMSPAALVELAKAAGGSQAAGAALQNASVADHPGVSAENLGAIQQHGSKPSSLRTGPPIHWLESEHVIPFAVGARLWELLSLALPGRGKWEDREQTTIMIYKGAADLKTKVDKQVIQKFKTEFAGSGLAADMSAARAFADGGGADGDRSAALSVLADLAVAVEEIRAEAVERTVQAVADENRTVEEGYELSNGERRAIPPDREPDLPTADDIESASQTQYDDIITLAEKAVRAADR